MKKTILLLFIIPIIISSCDEDEWTDSCGVVNGNNECLGCDNVPNSGLVNDPCGNCDGSGYFDDCGVCDDITNNDNSTCTQDCAGEWGGSAVNDDCGVCNGPGIDENCECNGTPHPDYVSLWDVCYFKYPSGQTIGLSGDQISGPIPPEIGELTGLQTLMLQNGGLTGSIPPEIGNLPNLLHLYLDGNQLTGSIPPEIGNLLNLEQLDIQDNQLTGDIPTEIGQLTNLQVLRLNENQLTGAIPAGISDLPLEIIRLSDNNFTSVQNSICQLPLSSAGGWASSIDDPISYVSTIFNNSLCLPYPTCIENYVGNQDTSNCP